MDVGHGSMVVLNNLELPLFALYSISATNDTLGEEKLHDPLVRGQNIIISFRIHVIGYSMCCHMDVLE